ncbi:MAG: hypothetical protein WBR18_14995 [Anaerolineales bacterium]
MKRLLSVMAVVVVVAMAFPLTAFAQGTPDGRIVFGGSFTLESGETMSGDLVVLGGSIVLEEGSTLEGSMVVLGGNAVVAAEVTGDISILGGNVNLLNSAIIRGDIISIGGNVQRADGATVEGSIRSEDGIDLPFRMPFGPVVIPSVPAIQTGWSGWAPVVQILWFAIRTLLMAALAVLIVMFWPKPTERIGDAIVRQPLAAGGLGLLTALVVPVVLVVLMITILLIPVSLIGIIGVVVAAILGWVSVGLEVGKRLAKSLNWEMAPAAAAGIGTLLLTFVVGGIGQIPCIGWIAPIVVISLGLGGVLLTRFGSQEYGLVEA